MNFFDSLREFLGIKKDKSDFPPANFEEGRRPPPDDFRRRNNSAIFPDDEGADMSRPRGFSIFSDPLEMHRYFEQQMNEVFQSFGMPDWGGGSFFGSFNMPAIEGNIFENESDDAMSEGNIRDQYLKPGYEKSFVHRPEQRIDRDIDGKLDMGDIDSVFKGQQRQVNPYQNKQGFKVFGQSISTKTVRRPDGSVEIHKTIRDNEGNEETTITRKFGDKEYSVTKKRNKFGEEESIEDLVNMDENEVKRIFESDSSDSSYGEKQPNWFPYDKFFK